jgi:nucleoside 2-deoxyribosyltransferase
MKMNNPTYLAYLAGPITGLSYGECTDWREWMHNNLPDNIIGLSPLRAKDYLKGEKTIAMEYASHVLSCERGISTRDYNDVKRCDVLVVNFLGAKTVSIGTCMEIAWAKAMQKPIVAIIEKEGNIHDHPMIRDSIGFRVETLEQASWVTQAILNHEIVKSEEITSEKLMSEAEILANWLCGTPHPDSRTGRKCELEAGHGGSHKATSPWFPNQPFCW